MQDFNHELFLKQVGANVRHIRLGMGFTMERLANEANIEIRQLGRIERGEINTTITSLKRLAVALDIKVSDFFSEDQP